MTRRAQHPAICPRCEDVIRVGDPIAKVGGRYCHLECGDGE